MAIKTKILGLSSIKGLISKYDKRKKNLKNRRGVNLSAVVTIEAWIKRNFTNEGKDHDDPGLRWPPLKASTIKNRRRGRGVGSPKILQDTGNLRNRWDRKADNRSGLLRSRQNYSSIHEEGRPSRNIPQRKIFPTKRQGQDIIRPVYEAWIDKKIRNI